MEPWDNDQTIAVRYWREINIAYSINILILVGIQDLLDNPNPKSPAQHDAYQLYVKNRAGYRKRIRQEVAKNPPVA